MVTTMKMKDIRELTDAEITHQLEELYKEKLNLNIQAKTGQLQNSARIKQVRRDIARIKMEMKLRAEPQESSV